MLISLYLFMVCLLLSGFCCCCCYFVFGVIEVIVVVFGGVGERGGIEFDFFEMLQYLQKTYEFNTQSALFLMRLFLCICTQKTDSIDTS